MAPGSQLPVGHLGAAWLGPRQHSQGVLGASQIRREVFGAAQRGHMGVSAGILQKSLVGTVQPNPLTFENW